MAILNAGLVLQIIFFVCSFVLAVAPGAVLGMMLADYSGGYTMSFDYIHFGIALVTTVIFGIMYTLLMLNMKKGNQIGFGIGIALGVLAYLSYYLATGVTTELVLNWINTVSEDKDITATWKLGVEKTIAYYTEIVRYQLMIKFALKTAIILVLVAFGVYATRNKDMNAPKKLY